MTVVAFDTASGRIGTLDGTAVIGDPPVDAVIWTSRLYPLEVVEAINASAGVRNGMLWPYPVDQMDVGATLVGGALPVVIAFQTYTAPPEDFIDVGATLLSGTLPVVIAFQTYTAPPEDFIDVGATLLDGTLITIVVFTESAEHLDVGATLIAGTLT